MVKAVWQEEVEDTPEAFELFADLFMEEWERWAGKVLIFLCMLNLLEKRREVR